MKNLRKIIALIAVAAMVLSSAAFAATFSDVPEGTVTFEAVETLNALGIIKGYEDGTFGPDKTITRAEFAAVICRAVGLDGIISKQATIFTDVAADNWASGYISMATQMRVVNGMGDGTFEPESPVTYEQAVKMIMVALGYEPKAKEKGGYPTGYLVSASDASVTSDIGAVNSADPAPRGLVARLLYKAIDTPLMEQVVYGGETTYQIQDGTNQTTYKTLMSEKLNVTKLKGIVVENPITALDSPTVTLDNSDVKAPTVKLKIIDNYDSSLSKYKVVENDFTKGRATLRVGTSNIASFLGKSVNVYVKEETGESNALVITAVPEATKNLSVTFNIDKFKGYTAKSTANGYSYNRVSYRKNDTDSKDSYLNLSSDLSVIYNGRYASVADAFTSGDAILSASTLANGEVEFIDNDNDGVYDVLFIKTPYIGVVDSVNVSKSKVLFKNAKTIDLDTETNTNIIYTILKDGKEIAISDLAEWDVLSVYVNTLNTSDRYYELKVVSNQVEGTITETGSSDTSWDSTGKDEEGKTYYVGGTEYDLAINAYNIEGLRNNANGIFFIDEFGKIAAFKKGEANAYNYGFITGYDTDGGSFQTVPRGAVQVVAIDGTYSTRLFAKYVSVSVEDKNESVSGDDNGVITQSDIVKALGGTRLEKLVGKLVRYSVNSSGQINDVEVAMKGKVSEYFSSNNGNIPDNYTYDESNERMSKAGSASTFYVDKDTIVFSIKKNDDGTYDVDDSGVKTIAALVDDNAYVAEAYDLDTSTGIAQCIVVYNDSTVSLSGSLCVVTGTSTTTNDAGENVANIKFYQDGEIKSLKTTSDLKTRASNLVKGTGVQFGVNGKGEIDTITELFKIGAIEKGKEPVVTFPAMKVVPEDVAANKDIIFEAIYDDAATVRKTLKLIFAPVQLVSGSAIKVGPKYFNDGANWVNLIESYNVSGANVYVYDINLTGDNRLLDGSAGDADYDREWDKNDTDYDTVPNNKLRDWVIIKDYDEDITDVVIIKAKQ